MSNVDIEVKRWVKDDENHKRNGDGSYELECGENFEKEIKKKTTDALGMR